MIRKLLHDLPKLEVKYVTEQAKSMPPTCAEVALYIAIFAAVGVLMWWR